MERVRSQFAVCVLLAVAIPSVLSTAADCPVQHHQREGTSVDWSYRNLTRFPNVPFDNVIELNVAFNRIFELREGDLSHLTHLLRVNVSHNHLSEVDQHTFFGLWRLQCVDLSNNRLTSLHSHTFHNLSSLLFLKLHGNRIQVLDPGSFEGLSRLSHLDLSNNELQVLANDTFCHLEQLAWLSLSSNCLSGLHASALSGLKNLTNLDLSDNSMCLSWAPKFKFPDWDMFSELTVTASNMTSFQTLLRYSSMSLDTEYFVMMSSDDLVQRHKSLLQNQHQLRALDLSGNCLQNMAVDLTHHKELRELNVSRNMLTTITLPERDALDTLAEHHEVCVRLRGNRLSCSCSNLDMVRWLWHTSVCLDGQGHPANYTCTAENGEITSTERVMANWLQHWRSCVGVQAFIVALSAFAVQLLGLIVTFILARSWPQLSMAWRTIPSPHRPRRQSFRKDAYVVYADVDDDVSLACVTLRQCLEDQYDVRLLLRNRDEIVGLLAENIIHHKDDSWKVLMLVTPAFCQGDWVCGFAVTQAQRSITATMPDRVIVVFFEDPGLLPAMPALDMLLRMVPEKNVLYIRPGTPRHHPVWKVLADMILDEPLKW